MGVGVGRTVGVGLSVGLADGVGVGVLVGVGLGDGVGVRVGVGTGVGQRQLGLPTQLGFLQTPLAPVIPSGVVLL